MASPPNTAFDQAKTMADTVDGRTRDKSEAMQGIFTVDPPGSGTQRWKVHVTSNADETEWTVRFVRKV